MNVKKIMILSSVVFSLLAGHAYAEKHSVSLGYATGHLSVDGDISDGRPDGMNFKYRYEFTERWGIAGAFTFAGDTTGDLVMTEWGYLSGMVGPTLRFNQYISLYYLMGLAKADTDVSTMSGSRNFKKNAFASSLGVQVNPWKNVVLDAAYEYARFSDYPLKGNDIGSGLFILGVGYHF